MMSITKDNTRVFELDGSMIVQTVNTSGWLNDDEWASYCISKARQKKPHIKSWKVFVVKELKETA